MPIPPRATGNVSLSANGRASGVEFRVNRTLSVANNENIGQRNVEGVSVSVSNTSATAQGSIDFAGTTTVPGRIGGALNNGAAFNRSPASLLDKLELSGSGATVTFQGGVGAQTLNFAQDNTAKLNGPATGSGDFFHKMNVTAIGSTTAAGGRGTLSFGNIADGRAANFWGDIGSSADKLKSLTIEQLDGGTRTVRILGNIYANGIALNGELLELGDGTTTNVFVTPRAPRPTYTVDAPITTTATVGGTLRIKNYDFNLKRRIGGADTSKLLGVSITNATATFDENIEAIDVSVAPRSGLKINKALTIAGRLSLNNSALGVAALNLGANKLTVGSTVTFTNTGSTSANRHKLLLTVGGATSGQLDASDKGVNLGSGLDITVNVAPDSVTSERKFIIVRSDSALPTSVTKQENVRVMCSSGFRCVLKLEARARGTIRDADLVVIVTPENPQIVNGPAQLGTLGETNGVEFQGDHTLTVPAASPAKTIGNRNDADSAPVSVTTQTDNEGTVNFAGSGAVSARIGSVLTNTTDGNTAFVNNPNPRRVKLIEISSANTVTFNGGIGAYTLNFTADGTAALNGPATAGADTFHKVNVTATAADGTGASGGRGTLSFGNTRAANVLGNIGTSAASLKNLTLASGSMGAVRLLGDIQAGGIALNGRTLTLGNGATNVFAMSDRARTYEVNAPITTNSDGSGALNIKDFKFNLKGPIGTPTAKLATLELRNATAMFSETINADAVALHNGSTLGITKSLTLAGTLALNNPSHGSTLALGAHALTLSGALSFNGTATHKLALTLGGATNGRGQRAQRNPGRRRQPAYRRGRRQHPDDLGRSGVPHPEQHGGPAGIATDPRHGQR